MKNYIFPLLLVLASPAFATDCESLSNVDAITCMEKQSFSPVTKNYKQLLALTKTNNDSPAITASMIKELEASQKAWLKYRDSYCNTYSNYHSEKANHANCIISLNEARAEQLENDIEAIK